MRRKKGRRNRKRRNRLFENSVALAGRVSPGQLTMPWTANPAKLASVVLLAAFFWSLFYLFTSEHFFVYEIDVSGHQFVASEEIYAQSGLDSLSVFFVDPSTVSQRLLELPNVKTAEVVTRMPSRITVFVTERLPRVILQKEDVRYWVDSEGVILPARGDLERAVVVQIEDGTVLTPGERFDLDALHTAQQLRELLPEVPHLTYSAAMGISVRTDEGWPVVFGTSEDLQPRVAIYRSLANKLSKEGTEVEFVDLRFEGRPYYRR